MSILDQEYDKQAQESAEFLARAVAAAHRIREIGEEYEKTHEPKLHGVPMPISLEFGYKGDFGNQFGGSIGYYVYELNGRTSQYKEYPGRYYDCFDEIVARILQHKDFVLKCNPNARLDRITINVRKIE